MDSFRDRFGVDWLQYKRLEERDQLPVICRSRSADEISGRPAAADLQSENVEAEQVKPQVSPKESSPAVDDTQKEEDLEVDEHGGGELRGKEEADELILGEEEDEKPEGKWVFTASCEGLGGGRVGGLNVASLKLYRAAQQCGTSKGFVQAGLKACCVY